MTTSGANMPSPRGGTLWALESHPVVHTFSKGSTHIHGHGKVARFAARMALHYSDPLPTS